ncbi:alpha/beta fold hydrolase [Cellulomonas aerilata]|uniref:alpha/beta fold hydrolase n=1 Tax=Cellulomonas aerilata TaxID=515326 RepID=UPI0011BF516C|nr:alpha/beta hydrolase [Cellulomonas aerilata]
MTTDGPLAAHTLARGDGTPLVLLPGFPIDARVWVDVVRHLPVGRTVIAVDPPGLGRSPDGEAVAHALGAGPEPSLETSADAVAATVRAAGLDRVVVAGLSMGGYVAMALVERHPDLVAGLALVDTRSTPDDDPGRANRLRVADAVLASGDLTELAGTPAMQLSPVSIDTRPELVEQVLAWIGDQRPSGVAWSQRAMGARPDRTRVLAGFRAPAVVVVGDQDRITPVPTAEHMMDVLPDAELVVVPGAGHLAVIEDPGTVAGALQRLLERVDRGTAA